MAIDPTPNSIMRMLNDSFDKAKRILSFQQVGWDGQGMTVTPASDVALKVTESGGYTYIAIAAPGTAQATAKWQVKRVDETVSGTTVITWADGNADFDNVSTDLTLLTYS